MKKVLFQNTRGQYDLTPESENAVNLINQERKRASSGFHSRYNLLLTSKLYVTLVDVLLEPAVLVKVELRDKPSIFAQESPAKHVEIVPDFRVLEEEPLISPQTLRERFVSGGNLSNLKPVLVWQCSVFGKHSVEN